MKKSPRKLLLSRETLRSLESVAVRQVAGGIEPAPATLICEGMTGPSCCCTMPEICGGSPSADMVICG